MANRDYRPHTGSPVRLSAGGQIERLHRGCWHPRTIRERATELRIEREIGAIFNEIYYRESEQWFVLLANLTAMHNLVAMEKNCQEYFLH